MNLLRYLNLPDDEEIARRIKLEPTPIADLPKFEPQEACKLIEKTLKDSFTPTSQIIALVRNIVGIARAHMATTYTDEQAFRDTCYRYDIRPDNPWHAVALTGLGGVGKTQLVRAIKRLLTADGGRIALDGMPDYPVELVWLLTMTQGTTLEALLRPLVPNERKGTDILISVAKRAYTNAVCLGILDESQFITATQEGHAKAAKTVMKTTYIGPPQLYCANYTMINKLSKRPQQERDRLLSNVLVLLPEARGSAAYESIIDGQLKVLGCVVESDSAVSAKKYAEAIHNYTFGIDRKSAVLFEVAWECARAADSEILKFCHIEEAYASHRFRSHREDVKILKQQAIENKMKREDLWCDFAPPMPTNVINVPSFGEEKQKRVSNALSRSTLTPEEREAFDLVSAPEDAVPGTKAKVVKHPKADKSLTALQNAGAAMLDGRK